MFQRVCPQPCEDYPQYHDLGLWSQQLRSVTGGELTLINTEAEQRVARALSQCVPITVVEPRVMRSGETRAVHTKKIVSAPEILLPLEEIDPDYVTIQSKIYPYFEGRKVEFFGESPMIMGKTAIVKYTGGGPSDAAFVNNKASISLALRSRQIWVPRGLIVPGYQRTNRTHFHYCCWEKISGMTQMVFAEPRVIQLSPVIPEGGRILVPSAKHYSTRFDELFGNELKPVVPKFVSADCMRFQKTSGLESVPPIDRIIEKFTSGKSTGLALEVEKLVTQYLQVEVPKEKWRDIMRATFPKNITLAEDHFHLLVHHGFVKELSTGHFISIYKVS